LTPASKVVRHLKISQLIVNSAIYIDFRVDNQI